MKNNAIQEPGSSRRGRRGVGLGAALLVLVWVGCTIWTGCSQAPKTQLPDPATGEFLTIEQQRALGAGQLSDYCQMLNDYLASLRNDIELAYALKDSLDQRHEELNAQHTELNRETRALEQKIKNRKLSRTTDTHYITREGDTLMKLASLFFGSAAEWRKIYDVNADLIDDPGEVLPTGIRLRIPK